MKPVLFFFFVFGSFGLMAQITETPYRALDSDPEWVKMMYAGSADLQTIRDAFDKYYADVPFEKNRDTQHLKRLLKAAGLETEENGRTQSGNRSTGEWKEAGPWHYDPEVAMTFQVQSPGACHIYTVEQSPTEPNTIWAGTATAGIWKSVNKGMKWELMSKHIPVNEVYSIAIDPFDNDMIYFGEGNGKIWQSMNGGLNWAPTGDAEFQNVNKWTRDLRVKPDENHVILAATNQGFFRSDDFALNWTLVLGGEFMEIEFHPEDPNIVYAVRRQSNTTQFLRSMNGGVSFSVIGAGWPFATAGQDQRRTEISVSDAAPNRVYALAAGEANGGSGLFGIYLSEDMGETWTFQCCGTGPAGPANPDNNVNILGWQGDGSQDGGQYYYDLALDVSPIDPDRMFGAGICVWRSLNAGQSWELNGHWVTWAGEFTMDRYVHADVHDIKFFVTDDGVDMWIACDGGVYYSSDQGDHIEPRMYGIHGTDFWGWQAGFKEGNVMAGGTYHNGTLIKNGEMYAYGAESEESGGWLAELAGDNFRGFINPADPEIGYHDNGSFRFSDDRFTRITSQPFDQSKLPNTSYVYGEYGNLEWDPRCMNRFYSPVGATLWRTDNGGTQWTEINNFGAGKIIQVRIPRSAPNVIHVTHRVSGSNWKVHRSVDFGQNWSEITPPGSIAGNNSGKAKLMDVDHDNAQIVWVIVHGSSANPNGKIWRTTDGGANWEDMTGSMGNENFTYIATQAGTDGGVYAGTVNGIFYRDNSMDDWADFSNGLPAKTPAVFIQPDYCGGVVRLAGSRGVFESSLFGPSQVTAGFMADRLEVNLAASCDAHLVRFFDTSVLTCEGAIYEWQFPGANPPTSNEMNPEVEYSEPGLYSVTLTVTDSEGQSHTLTRTDMIQVFIESFSLPLSEDFNGPMFPPAGWKIYDPEGNGAWEKGTQPGNSSNGVAQFPNYWVDTAGQTDLLLIPALDFSNVQNPVMTFDVSYHTYSSYVDGLAVIYKTDSDPNWYTLYEKVGSQLHVSGNYIWFWYDEGGAVVWRNEEIDLSPLVGQSCVQLAFSNIGGYGNHIWVDNVNIDISNSINEEEISSAGLFIYPNPASEMIHVQITGQTTGNSIEIRNAIGQTVDVIRPEGNMTSVSLKHFASGIYTIRLTGENTNRVVRFVKN